MNNNVKVGKVKGDSEMERCVDEVYIDQSQVPDNKILKFHYLLYDKPRKYDFMTVHLQF